MRAENGRGAQDVRKRANMPKMTKAQKRERDAWIRKVRRDGAVIIDVRGQRITARKPEHDAKLDTAGAGDHRGDTADVHPHAEADAGAGSPDPRAG